MSTRFLITSGAAGILAFAFACTIRDVTVVDVGSVQIEPSSVTLLEGEVQDFTAQAKDGLGKTLPSGAVTWSSDAPGVFSIDPDGRGEGMTAGQTTVWATLEGTRGSATVVVEPGPRITVDETPLAFFGTVGGEPPDPVILDITNGGKGSLGGITASVEYPEGGAAGWLSIALAGTSAPTTLHLSVLIGILDVGIHEANLILTSPDARNSPVSIPVQMEVTLDRPVIGLSPNVVEFQAVERGDPPPPQTVQVTNEGGGVLADLEASPLYFGIGGWLSASLTGTTAPTQLEVQADPAGLPPGTYHAEVRIIGPGALNTPQAVDVTLTVDDAPGADLEIIKSGPTGAAAGGGITYDLTVQNLGPGKAEGVVVTDTLPPGATFSSATGGGRYSGAAGVNGVVEWDLGDLTVADGPQTVHVNLSISAGASGELVNVAAVQGLWLDPDLSNNRSTLTTSLGATADLAVGKSGPATGVPGTQIAYTVTVRNYGPSNASGVVLRDELPTGVTFVSASGGGSYSASSGSNGVVTWSLGTVEASSNASSFQVVVQVGASTAGAVVNTATVSSSTPEASVTNNRATATTTVSGSDLTVSKSGPAVADPGEQITYSVTFQNEGPSDATGVVVTDILPAGVTFVSASGGGTESGGVVSWDVGGLTVAAGAQNRTVTVTVGAGTSGSIENVAAVTCTSTDPDLSDNQDTFTTDVQSADLSVSKTGPGSAAPGANIAYTVTVQNNGPSPATGVVVRDTLPATATFVSATGGATPSGGVITWNLANLAASASQNYTVTVSTASGATGSIRNAANVSADQFDGNTGNNHDDATTTLGASADLALSKSGPGSAVPGGQITYTLTVENLGPSDATGVVVTDPIPAAVAFVSASAGGSYDAVSKTVTWSVGDLAASGSQSMDLVVEVAVTEGAVINSAEVAATTPDPVSGNDQATATTSVSGADLSLSKTGPPTAASGETITYNITVQNGGPSTATEVVVTDNLPTGVTFVSATPTASVSGSTVTWPATTTPTLASGATANFSLQVTIDETGTLENSAAVSSSSSDYNGDNNTDSATTESYPVLAVTTISLPDGVIGTAYSQSLAATGGDGSYTWTLTAGTLPAALSLATNGTIAGNPSTAGTSNFTVQVQSGDGQVKTAALSITIDYPVLAVTTASLPDGVIGSVYSQSLSASGGDSSYSWTVTVGSLPAGLSLGTTGTISGTPTTVGTSNFTVQVQSGDGQTDDAALSITINYPPPVVTTTSLPDGVVGAAYSQSLSATGGDGSYTWTVTVGSLPAGLSLATNGTISGTPTTGGTSNFTVQVQSGDGQTDDAPLSITINYPPPVVTTTSLPDGVFGAAYSQSLSATGGDGSYSWTVTVGSLPVGLSLATNGTISGTPTAVGTSNFTVQVGSGDGQTASAALSITVNYETLAVTTASLPDGLFGTGYSQSLSATGGDGSYTWTVTAGSLPAGLSLATNGTISGTPTGGTSSFTVQVQSGDGQTDDAALSITINYPVLAVTTTTLADGVVGTAYSQSLSATGGDGSYTWTVTTGALPAGLTLGTNGTISGTPTTVSTSNFTVQVQSGDGQTDTAALSIHIGNEILAVTAAILVDDGSDVTESKTRAYSGSTSGSEAQTR